MMKIMLENQKRENITFNYVKSKELLSHKSPSRRWFSNGIHSLLRRADARESSDIIYHM